ncbi:3126_t:CDS:2, partial [Funneliformis mosseae]
MHSSGNALHVKASKMSKIGMKMPPLVRYKFPIIGHTYSYMFDSAEFFKQCRKEYGDIFSLYIWGQVMTFVGKDHIHEVLSRDDAFDSVEFFSRKILIEIGDIRYNAFATKKYITNKLELYSERMQKSILSGIQRFIGECEEPTVLNNLYFLLTKLIAVPTANIFIGEEEAKSDEVITTFARFTFDNLIYIAIPPIFDLIYPGLQDYVNKLTIRLGLYNPATKNLNVLVKLIKKQIGKRLQEKQEYGDLWKRPNDMLQDIIEEKGFDLNYINYSELADKMALFILISMINAPRACANALIDLASRTEYMQELYEEQLEVVKEADKNGILPLGAFNKMKKLDSFVKESLRLTGDVVAFPHITMKNYTFSNGLQVPRNHIVDLYYDDIYLDESLQGQNPNSFDPFRHFNKNSPAAKVSKDFLAFGGSKHACPGRFLAVNEIKFFMHNVILKYNVRTKSGKIEEKWKLGPLSFPSLRG